FRRVLFRSDFTLILESDKMAQMVFYSDGPSNGKIDPSEGNLSLSINQLKSSKKIEPFSHGILTRLNEDTKKNYEGRLSHEELKSNINGYIREYNSHAFPKGSGEGEMVGSILAISLASM